MAMKLYPDTAIQDIADAIRSKNGSTDTYTVGQMAQAIEDIPSGGSDSSLWKHLETITVPEDTRAVNIDVTNYNSNYDCLICYGDIAISPTDWIYIVKNGSSPSGGSYINGGKNTTDGIVFMIGRMIGNNASTSKFTGTFSNGVAMSAAGGIASNFYIYAYSSASVMKAGSTFKIYGVNYADL